MATIDTKQAISLTAQYTGYNQDTVQDVLESYADIVHKLLVNGCSVKFPKLGTFYLKLRPARPARENWTNPLSPVPQTLKAVPARYTPQFKYYPSIFKEVRDNNIVDEVEE